MDGFIDKKIKSVWMEKVGVHEKYIAQALKEKKGLRLIVKDREMLIPADKVESKIVGTSDVPFKDSYHGTIYWLKYYKWKPDPVRQPNFFQNNV